LAKTARPGQNLSALPREIDPASIDADQAFAPLLRIIKPCSLNRRV